MAFKKVAQTFESSFLFAVARPVDSKCSMCSSRVPSVAVFRHNDLITPVVTLTTDLTEQGIEEFVKKSRVPTLPELTVDIFPLLYSQEKPFVVLFCNASNPDEKTDAIIPLAEVLESGTFPGVIFTWIDGTDDVGKAILKEYDPSAVLPALSFVSIKEDKEMVTDYIKRDNTLRNGQTKPTAKADGKWQVCGTDVTRDKHLSRLESQGLGCGDGQRKKLKDGEVYNMPDEQMTKEYVSQWLQQVSNRKLEPSKMLKTGNWKPLKQGYDYLKLQDFEAKYGSEARSVYDSLADEVPTSEDRDQSKMSEDSSVDDEIRAELLELRKSRLYNLQERKGKDKKEEKAGHTHTEL